MDYSNLPEVYKPVSLRPVMYGISMLNISGGWEMLHGPTPDIKKLLNTVPEENSTYILFLSATGSNDHVRLHQWDSHHEHWEKCVE
jgi:hypothetical protein